MKIIINFIPMLLILNGYLICALFPIFGLFACLFIPFSIFEDIFEFENKEIAEYKLFQLAFLHVMLSIIQVFILIYKVFNIWTIIYIIIFQMINIVIAYFDIKRDGNNS